MDVLEMVRKTLKAQRAAQIDAALAALGEPAASTVAAVARPKSNGHKSRWTPAARRRAAVSAKARWAVRKANGATGDAPTSVEPSNEATH